MLYLPPGDRAPWRGRNGMPYMVHRVSRAHQCRDRPGFPRPSCADRPPAASADPGARPARHPGDPGRCSSTRRRRSASIRWSDAEIREFAGRQLSEVKAHVFFEPPRTRLARARSPRARRLGLALDRGRASSFLARCSSSTASASRCPGGARGDAPARRPARARCAAGRAGGILRRAHRGIARASSLCGRREERAAHRRKRRRTPRADYLHSPEWPNRRPRSRRSSAPRSALRIFDITLAHAASTRPSAWSSCASSWWRGAPTGCTSRCTRPIRWSATVRGSSRCCASSRCRSRSTARLAQARNATDPFVVADDRSVWRQMHYEQPRSIVALHSPRGRAADRAALRRDLGPFRARRIGDQDRALKGAAVSATIARWPSGITAVQQAPRADTPPTTLPKEIQQK